MADWPNDTSTEGPSFSIPAWFSYPTWSPYIPGTAVLEYSKWPPIMPTPEPENALFKNISLAVRVVLFIACLIENSIAIYILCKSIKNGRKMFSQYILINMACADILTTLLLHPVEFVNFHHGKYIWVVEGPPGDVLCKLYGFLFQIPDRVLILSLVALAFHVSRNLSSKGRKEHTGKFSARLIVFFWIFAATPSIMYIAIGKVESNFCYVDPTKEDTRIMMDKIHLFVFMVSGDVILTILNPVVFFRVRRRKREIKRKREARRAGEMKEARREKRIGDKKYAKVERWRNDAQQEPMLSNNGWCQPDGKYFPAGAIPQQQNNPSNPSGTLIEMSNGNKNLNEVDEANGMYDVHVDQEDDGTISVDEPDQEESFETTREEAKITGVASTLFVVLSIIEMMFWYVCVGSACIGGEYYEYVAFAIEIAKGIYAAIKPGIYAGIDKEFRKRYTQLSPLAYCCFRQIRCHKEPNQVGTRNSLSTQMSNV